jgi:hypothetical protein
MKHTAIAIAAKRATRVARSMVKARILKTQEGSRWDRRKGKRERNGSLDERRKRGKERSVCCESKRREREEEKEKTSCSRKDGPINTQGRGPKITPGGRWDQSAAS